jgi:alcohol dehydrogenase class IV
MRPPAMTMAWVSLCGGMALANGGLGAVHGLAGRDRRRDPAAHGAICGVLLGPVLAMNRDRCLAASLKLRPRPPQIGSAAPGLRV